MKTLKNGTIWQDVNGEPIHAHGGYIISYEGWYYWYGEDRRDRSYVSCYRSRNLTDWEFRRPSPPVTRRTVILSTMAISILMASCRGIAPCSRMTTGLRISFLPPAITLIYMSIV